MMRKKIDIIWLVEHVARELDVACAAKCIVEENFGLNVIVGNIYQHAKEFMLQYVPGIVVYPFFYRSAGALAIEDYVKMWPKATHFNLAWEELFYRAHEKVKAPSDEFTKKKVVHHAWGEFYRQYLEKNEVTAENIFVNGNPAYQLYRNPYSQYYQTRNSLAQKYRLNETSRWVFFPENYRWAFIGKKIDFFARLGGDPNEMLEMRDFSVKSLKQVLRWCNQTSKEENVEIIFRPRPATNSEFIRTFFKENIGSIASNLHIIKGESVREWILASDIVFSSYSTTLIEAAVAGKPIYMAEPTPIPDSLYYEWFRYVPRIRTKDEFMNACINGLTRSDGQALRCWAEKEMLQNGDPITRLADYLNQLIVRKQYDHKKARRVSINAQVIDRLSAIQTFLRLLFSKKKYLNNVTHENDVFCQEDVDEKVNAWRKILF